MRLEDSNNASQGFCLQDILSRASQYLLLLMMTSDTAQRYSKHFIPLESNPEVFTELIHGLGVRPSLSFQDVLSLDDAELLGFLPRPVHALILVFPTSEAYERRAEAEDAEAKDYVGGGDGEDVVFFRQTINNACGLYAILHAVCNGQARQSFEANSPMDRLLKKCLPARPRERALALEGDEDLARVYAEVAVKGDTEAPADAEEEIDFHYIAFVKSHIDGSLYQLDGDRKRPIRLDLAEDGEDVLSEKCLTVIRRMMAGDADSLNFSLMALPDNGSPAVVRQTKVTRQIQPDSRRVGAASWANRSANRSTAACTAATQDATRRDAPEGLVGVSEDQVAGARVASYNSGALRGPLHKEGGGECGEGRGARSEERGAAEEIGLRPWRAPATSAQDVELDRRQPRPRRRTRTQTRPPPDAPARRPTAAMTKKRKRYPDLTQKLERPWCYYCERDFDDLKILISHQKAKHFKCDRCGRRLNTAGGLSVHMNQVHKENLTHVENAIGGRQGLDIEIFGMEGVPAEIVDQHNQHVTQKHFAEEAERARLTGNPVRGLYANGQAPPNKRKKVTEALDAIEARANQFRHDRQNGILPAAPAEPAPPVPVRAPPALLLPALLLPALLLPALLLPVLLLHVTLLTCPPTDTTCRR
ncbi:ubiquitin carboxyl-terminal hydrolase, family 1, partial [Stagonosporopsis vannaccii]